MFQESRQNFERISEGISKGVEEVKKSGKEAIKTTMEGVVESEPLNGEKTINGIEENAEDVQVPEEIFNESSPKPEDESASTGDENKNERENEGNPEDKKEAESEHQQHEREMDKETNEAREEVEARFKEALAQLYARICVAEAHNKKPLSESKIREAIDNTEVLSEMWPLPKNSLAHELKGILKDINKKKENEKIKLEEAKEMFVDKAMETNTLGLIMDLAAMKEGGDNWLYEKQAQMLKERQSMETPAETSHEERGNNPPEA